MPSDADFLGEASEGLEITPDPSITRDLFLKWRSPRLGASNPELMTNPVWDWLVRSKANAYQATQRFNGPSAMDAGPGWCFDRFGQSKTQLPDGRIVLISGEHEDHYDPDFYIYNDVVVRHPNGGIEIFGYPRDVFPPTDFHSGTLVGHQIVIVGNLDHAGSCFGPCKLCHHVGPDLRCITRMDSWAHDQPVGRQTLHCVAKRKT